MDRVGPVSRARFNFGRYYGGIPVPACASAEHCVPLITEVRRTPANHFAAEIAAGHGQACLFTGTDAVARTGAVAALGYELGREVLRIDASRVVNKYIGETEKNLGRLFDSADPGSVILFFDEADALFGKRSDIRDSHDRFANIEIAYLFGRIETYGGLVIVSTNLFRWAE